MENGDKSLAMIKINFSKALTKQDGLKFCCDFEKMVVLFCRWQVKKTTILSASQSTFLSQFIVYPRLRRVYYKTARKICWRAKRGLEMKKKFLIKSYFLDDIILKSDQKPNDQLTKTISQHQFWSIGRFVIWSPTVSVDLRISRI